MPRYEVSVTLEKTVTVKVWAKDEAAAEEKAEEIVSGWDDVTSAEANGAEEIDG